MPNRILRDWTDSQAFDGISAEAERLFVRLIMKADDFGRFHANPKLVKAACFPLAEDLRANTVAAWLTELSDRQLVFCYTSGTGEYLAIPRFRQRSRAEKSRFPAPEGKPPDWIPPPDDGQVTVNGQSAAHVFGDEGEFGGGDGKRPHHAFPKTYEQAVGQCEAVDSTINPEFVRDVWEQAKQRGGQDAASTQITCFSTYARRRWRKEQMKWEAERKENSKTNGSKWVATV